MMSAEDLSIPQKIRRLSVSRSVAESDDTGDTGNNGLLFNNIPLPIEVIQRIFCFVDEKSLLSCHLVCKRWNEIIMDYVWRKKAEIKTGCKFSIGGVLGWKDFYGISAKQIFERNLLKIQSGEKNLKYWKVLDGHRISEIDMEREGFSINILDNLQPPIEISEWFSSRWDYSAYYRLEVYLMNSSGDKMDKFVYGYFLYGNHKRSSFSVKHEFKNYGRGLRKIRFVHGCDQKFWAGHYGSKMAGACVKVEIPDKVKARN